VTDPVNDPVNDLANDLANELGNDRVKGSVRVTGSLNENFHGMVRVPGWVASWLDRLESGHLECIASRPTMLDDSGLHRGLRNLYDFQDP
jgi:hypothetical protein